MILTCFLTIFISQISTVNNLAAPNAFQTLFVPNLSSSKNLLSKVNRLFTSCTLGCCLTQFQSCLSIFYVCHGNSTEKKNWNILFLRTWAGMLIVLNFSYATCSQGKRSSSWYLCAKELGSHDIRCKFPKTRSSSWLKQFRFCIVPLMFMWLMLSRWHRQSD